MPLTKESDYGTNLDGSQCVDFCCHCFVKGEFQGYMTVEEAIADSINFAEYAGMTKEEMLVYAKEHYPKLKRWAE